MIWVIIIVCVIAFFVFINKDKLGLSKETDKTDDKINLNANLSFDLTTCKAKAAQNDKQALFELGYRYYYAIGVKKDIGKAEEYTRRSAELKYPNGMYFYYVLYYNKGENYNINRNLAEKSILNAANLKNYDCKFLVAEAMYKNLINKIPSVLTEGLQPVAALNVIISLLCESFSACKLSPPKCSCEDDIKSLLRKTAVTLSMIIEKRDNITEEKAKACVNSIIASHFEKQSNRQALLRELGINYTY
jgi:hypothetical protein